MDTITLEAQPREVGGKQARALRREGQVPCVLYGHHTEPVHFHLPVLTIARLVHSSETHRVTISVSGEEYDCILKEVNFHPITDDPRHADFQALTAGEALTLTVPIHFEGTPVGQTEGGDTQYVMHEIEVRCLPKDIPDHISIDISHLSVGDSMHVSDLEMENVTFETSPERTIVTVVPPRLLELEGEEEEEEGLTLGLTDEESDEEAGEEDEEA